MVIFSEKGLQDREMTKWSILLLHFCGDFCKSTDSQTHSAPRLFSLRSNKLAVAPLEINKFLIGLTRKIEIGGKGKARQNKQTFDLTGKIEIKVQKLVKALSLVEFFVELTELIAESKKRRADMCKPTCKG